MKVVVAAIVALAATTVGVLTAIRALRLVVEYERRRAALAERERAEAARQQECKAELSRMLHNALVARRQRIFSSNRYNA